MTSPAIKPLSLSRHPFELFVLVLMVLVGVPLLFGDAKPNSLASLLPPLLENIWALLLSGGGALALLGIWWKDRATGLIMEQIGLLASGFACLIYCLTLCVTSWPPSLVSSAIVGSFGAACVWRAVQIERLVRAGISHG